MNGKRPSQEISLLVTTTPNASNTTISVCCPTLSSGWRSLLGCGGGGGSIAIVAIVTLVLVLVLATGIILV